MAAVLGTLEHYGIQKHSKRMPSTSGILSWLAELFGCPHKELSRPFSRQGETYRVCINCGARRGFDQRAWNSTGPFYFSAASTSNLLEAEVSTVRAV